MKMEDYEEENELINNQEFIGKIPPLSKDQTNEIMSQMEQSICKIDLGDKVGTGFLCKIPFPTKFHYIGVLITNNHVLKEDYLKLNNNIKITLNDGKIERNILIDKTRKIFTNENMDVTILEIKEEDNINNKYLDIDENIFDEELSKKIYEKDKIIYSLQYPQGKEVSFSVGKMNFISQKYKYYFYHLCSTIEGSSGSPILLLSNYKVIGIHKGNIKGNIKNNMNVGILIKFAIDGFNQKYHNINNINNINNNINNIENIIIDNSDKYEDNKSNKIIKSDKKNNLVMFEIFDDLKNELINGKGFLCKIYPNNNKNNTLPILITCNNFLNDSYFNQYKLLNISYFKEDEKIEAFIDLSIKRIIYQNKDLNITIIEIKEEDNIDINSFLEVDDRVNLIGQKIYIFYYSQYNNTNCEKINSEIIDIDKEYSFTAIILSEDLSGYPIINFDNNCVIGIINQTCGFVDETLSLGYLINKIIKSFFEKNIDILKSSFEKNENNNEKKNDFYPNNDSIDLIYDINTIYQRIRIINNKFINRYDKICKIIYNNKEYPLIQYFHLDKINLYDSYRKEIKITLKGLNLVTDMSYMFDDCVQLKKVDLSRINMSKIISMESMFENCENLVEISDTSLWNVENVKSMKHLFYSCKKLKCIPGIEHWDPRELDTCEKMFQHCESLSQYERDKIYSWKNVSKLKKDEAFSNFTYYADKGAAALGFCKDVISNFFN